MGFAPCEFDGCKTAQMRVGAHLGPMIEKLRDGSIACFIQ